jgi:hypothetical protein
MAMMQESVEGIRYTDAIAPVTSHLLASGKLDVVRITKGLRESQSELVFAGVPARAGTRARRIVVHFASGTVPSPRFDQASGTIELFYSRRDHPEVQAMLNSKLARFCYFWQSAKGEQTHAWLLTSG